MRLIVQKASSGRDVTAAVAVFGAGLVGGSIIHALLRAAEVESIELPFNWTDHAKRASEFGGLSHVLDGVPGLAKLHMVWAAGRVGFAASGTDAESELPAYREVLDWLTDRLRRQPKLLLKLHLVSSAGGLFEGQRFVDHDSRPLPFRPYGELKLEQERLATALPPQIAVNIYRPSSVYGHGGARTRSGLINTLIMNAKKQMPSRIFGGMGTIRDYVLVSDVGQYIAACINSDDRNSSSFFLAGGKPSSLGEVLTIVERVLGRPLLISLDPQPTNASHITFRSSALPPGWRPTDMETGVRQVMRQLSEAFETPARL